MRPWAPCLFACACAAGPRAESVPEAARDAAADTGRADTSKSTPAATGEPTAAPVDTAIAARDDAPADTAAPAAGASDAAPDARDATAAADAPAVAAALDGYRLESPCSMHDEPTACKTLPATDKQTHVVKFGGAAGTVYEVVLRVRGVVEPMAYTGGTQTGFFYVGGKPNNGSYNIYKMSVPSPKADYFFNAHAIKGDEIFTLDYRAKVLIEGGSSLTFVVDGQNKHQVSNFGKVVVPGIPPAPKHYDGQFVHLTVESVEPMR